MRDHLGGWLKNNVTVLITLLSVIFLGGMTYQKIEDHERRVSELEEATKNLPAMDRDIQWMVRSTGGVPATRPVK